MGAFVVSREGNSTKIMGMTRPERIETNLRKAKGFLIGAIEVAIKHNWHGGNYEQIAATLDIPNMTLDNIMRSYHIGPYDRRKDPR